MKQVADTVALLVACPGVDKAVKTSNDDTAEAIARRQIADQSAAAFTVDLCVKSMHPSNEVCVRMPTGSSRTVCV